MPSHQSRSRRTREETEEDAYIAILEAKLGYSRGAKRRKGDEADGLDDLLDFANTLDESTFGVASQPNTVDGQANRTEEDQPKRADKVQSNRPEERQDEVVKLTRRLKGLVNRMSEQNMSTILDAARELYQEYGRHDVTATFSNLIVGGISSHDMLIDSFIVLHAALVSGIYRLIGVESAGYVVQNVVLAYERHLQICESGTSDVRGRFEQGKECANLVVFISELYNFQVISCDLLYDIIKDLLSKSLSEFRVGLLLQILRISGQQLRQDDPAALKDIVTLAQAGVANQAENSSRTRFMIETLADLKNNKIKKSAAQHQGGDVAERMKVFLSRFKARDSIRISLENIRSAATQVQWREIETDPPVDRQGEMSRKRPEVDGQDINHAALLKLARKQGMNTDVRRSIFIVLMSSSDYLDACDRLGLLSLSEVQQRETVRVILHCCGKEKSYNPYYTLVCQHLCQTSHSYKVTLQFCLWDFLRDLGETGVGGAEVVKTPEGGGGQCKAENISSLRMKNMAKAYGWWIAKDCCSLRILKPLDFTALKPLAQKFLRELFVQLFAASQVTSPILTESAFEQPFCNQSTIEGIFIKAVKIDNLGSGLIFFLSQVFREDEGLLKWASTVAKKILQAEMSKVAGT